MSIAVTFWDVSQLNETELQVLDVAKNRFSSLTIEEMEGHYRPAHQQVIDQWTEEKRVVIQEGKLKLSPAVVPYDFSDRTDNKDVTKYLQEHEIALTKERFEEYLPSVALKGFYPTLLKHGILSKGALSPSILCSMGSLLEEIRNDCLGRSNRKGVTQYHQRCDFTLWLMLELQLIKKAYSHFDEHDYYEVDEYLFRQKKEALEAP
ncbi:MAG: hypothetical protein ACRBFS_07950 [Aureispira sp.]